MIETSNISLPKIRFILKNERMPSSIRKYIISRAIEMMQSEGRVNIRSIYREFDTPYKPSYTYCYNVIKKWNKDIEEGLN